MRGSIDGSGRALLGIRVASEPTPQPVAIQAWIDTGFTGELVLPQQLVDSLTLHQSGTVDAILADGSQIEVKTYTCFVHWFGEKRRLEVVANDGNYPLLGVGLLLGFELRANYQTMDLVLDFPSSSDT
jgi:clan AA aspartic protease